MASFWLRVSREIRAQMSCKGQSSEGLSRARFALKAADSLGVWC